jgi:hypothetical protein
VLNFVAGDKLQNNIQRWLSPPDPWKNYNDALKSRLVNTGAWFTNGNTLSEWKTSGPSSLLWIHGKRQLPLSAYFLSETETKYFRFAAGAGKSVLWYVNPLPCSSRQLTVFGQFDNYQGDRDHAEIRTCLICNVFL